MATEKEFRSREEIPMILNKMKKRLKNLILAFLTATFCFQLAYAADNGGGEELFNMYKTIRAVSSAFAVVGIAGSAIQIIVGDTQNAARAKQRLIVISMAVAGMWILPTVINMGKPLFGQWEPH